MANPENLTQAEQIEAAWTDYEADQTKGHQTASGSRPSRLNPESGPIVNVMGLIKSSGNAELEEKIDPLSSRTVFKRRPRKGPQKGSRRRNS